MRSETIVAGDISALVHSRTRRTPIIEAQYKQALVKAYPEIQEYERAQLALVSPRLPMDAAGKISPKLKAAQTEALVEYTRASIALRNQHPVGAAYAEEALGFTRLLARIAQLQGTAFDIADGTYFSDEAALAAFNDWLDNGNEENGFWLAVVEVVARIDAPLTSVVQRPPETLSEEEQASPLSEPLDVIGNTA